MVVGDMHTIVVCRHVARYVVESPAGNRNNPGFWNGHEGEGILGYTEAIDGFQGALRLLSVEVVSEMRCHRLSPSYIG